MTPNLIEAMDRARAAKMGIKPEDFDRTSRRDFWNDPERWEGIDDPHKVMIWEVRRPDRIDVRQPEKPKPHPATNIAMEGNVWRAAQSPLAAYQQSMNQFGLNQMRQRSVFWPFF